MMSARFVSIAVTTLLLLSSLYATQAQTTVSLCYTTYDNLATTTNTDIYWASNVVALLTLNTTTPYASLSGTYSVTSVSGSRSVATLDGLGQVASSTQISLAQTGNGTNACVGCDNLITFPIASGGPFDTAGLGIRLAAAQTDLTACVGRNINLQSYASSTCTDNSLTTINAANTLQIAAPGTLSCPLPQIVVPPVQCGIGGYDFSSLASGSDLIFTTNNPTSTNYTLYFRMCGSVSAGVCTTLFGKNVQVCQVQALGAGQTGTNNIYVQAVTNSPAGGPQFGYVNGVDGSAGINFTIADGQYCGSAPRIVYGTLSCGTSNMITSYSETSTCNYRYTITTPLACPLVQQFSVCMIASTATPVTYNNWLSIISGTVNATMAPASSDANLGQSPTYIVQNAISLNVQLSTLYMGTTNSSNSLGAVAGTYPGTILAPGGFGGNDNVMFYTGDGYAYFTQAGFDVGFTVGGRAVQSNTYYQPQTGVANGAVLQYGDDYNNGGSVILATIGVGANSATPCAVPTQVTTATAGVTSTAGFCHIAYTSTVFSEYTNSEYFSSYISGTMQLTSTTSPGKYAVNSISATRSISSNGGTGIIVGTTTATLGSPAGTQYVYYQSPLLQSGVATDTTGLTFSLATNQTDPSQCSGNTVTVQGQNEVCSFGLAGASSAYFSQYSTFLVVPGATSAPTCNPTVIPLQPYYCGIGQYNFTSLANQQISLTQRGYTVFMALCGSVTQPDCVRNFGTNSMACQWSAANNNYELISTNSPFGVPEFGYVNGVDATAGILMTVSDGQRCNDGLLYPRQVQVTIVCGTTTRIVFYEEGSTCNYIITLLSPLACPPVPVLAPALSSCSIGNYDFSPLALLPNDMVGDFGSFSVAARLCGSTTTPICANSFGNTAMFCQFESNGNTNSLASATNTSGQIAFSYVNGVNGNQGISYALDNGAQCGSYYARQVKGTITCGQSNRLLSFAESPTCTYTINIQTPIMCPGYNPSTGAVVRTTRFGFCLIVSVDNLLPGYTLMSSLLSGVMTTSQSNTSNPSQYSVTSITGYRLVTSNDGLSTITSNASISGLLTGNGASNIIYYNPNAGANSVYIDAQGIALGLSTSQSDSFGCVGSTITLSTDQVICANGLVSTSGYTLTVVPLVNGAVSSCPIPQAPVIPARPFCGIQGVVDFSSMATAGDLSLAIPNSFTVYMRLCGAVSQVDCANSFGGNAQVCQWYGAGNVYEISTLNYVNGETSFAYANGLNAAAGFSYTISDGQTCNINNVVFNRVAFGNITCGTTANITTAFEVPNNPCHYNINIVTPLACVAIPSSSSSTSAPVARSSSSSSPSSSSSSSSSSAVSSSAAAGGGSNSNAGSSSSSNNVSNGAIAGIVIGCFIGGAILAAFLIFCCCGFVAGGALGAFGKSKGGNSQYSQQAEASHNPASHVEMAEQSQVGHGENTTA